MRPRGGARAPTDWLPPVLHLYHVPKFRSTRVLWLIGELAQHYTWGPQEIWVHEFTDVAAFRNAKPRWLLDLNPNGKVPTVAYTGSGPEQSTIKHSAAWTSSLLLPPRDDDRSGPWREGTPPLFEGGAIMCTLLDSLDKHGTLLSRDERALFLQLAFYCAGTVDNLTAASSPIQRAVMLHKDDAASEKAAAAATTSPPPPEGSTEGGGQFETAPAEPNPSPPRARTANMDPTVDPVRRTAWDTVVGPFLESVVARTPGEYVAGEAFSAADVVLGMDLYAFHERMIARTPEKRSWLDPTRLPRLHALATTLAQRPARRFAFEATLADPATLDAMATFGIARWIPAMAPAEAVARYPHGSFAGAARGPHFRSSSPTVR